jgi:hypothetical protein
MYTMGADPEVFIQKDGELLPVCGLIGGTKNSPRDLGDGNGYAVQEDNVMLEFNIPPCKDAHSFMMAIDRAKQLIQDEHLSRLGAMFRQGCAEQFKLEALDSRQAREFGCSPDFDAYENGKPFPKIDPDELIEGDSAWRFAGGHIHLGYDFKIPPFVVASFCDVFIGVAALRYGDTQGIRRTLYGQPGRYRPTSYGLEYRTLSNFWLFCQDALYEVSNRGFRLMNWLGESDQVEIRKLFSEIPWVDVRRALATEDTSLATMLDNYFWQELMKSHD